MKMGPKKQQHYFPEVPKKVSVGGLKVGRWGTANKQFFILGPRNKILFQTSFGRLKLLKENCIQF